MSTRSEDAMEYTSPFAEIRDCMILSIHSNRVHPVWQLTGHVACHDAQEKVVKL